ncbi:YhgE/Pip domain-containing protein [Sporosarcina sp. Te-1]|uniref:YhgE/Pip domain-containing protein n=1 Tax=Sporosarcina sp. Te-1 TaxID=2818390 RepID=UPI001A9F382A|nr:ABC transporter permease [Sporosarcina sp. Te-1]QTD43093.1 ABC transporter permease [Sporosarcina sp. Te-1]
MNALQALLRLRGTYIGIIAAVMFQLIFFSVWLTAYNGVQDRTHNLAIGMVNEDQNAEPIAKELQQNLPVQTKQFHTLEEAFDQMNEREVNMVIHIPENFVSSLGSESRPSIQYWINQANATSSKTMMEQLTFEVTNKLNTEISFQQKTAATGAIEQQLNQLPVEPAVAQAIGEAFKNLAASIQSEPIDKVVHKTNAVDQFSANLVPLMVIISSFVGAMVMIMQINEAAGTLRTTYSKWGLFFGRQIINIAVAFLLPLLTIGLMNLFDVASEESFVAIYLFQGVMFLSFLLVAQVFVYVFGNYGMVFNILALSLQLVTSGVLVARELLPSGYHAIASFLPATYGADGYYTIVFGGNEGALFTNITPLLLIAGSALLVTAGAVFLRREKKSIQVNESSLLMEP